jgi:O-antigen/teichoic acid export membrane protein
MIETPETNTRRINPSITEFNKDIGTLATGASITLIGKVGGRGIDAVSDVVLARLLGPSDFGLYSLGITVLRIAGTIGMLGLQNGIIRFGTRFWPSSPSNLKKTLYYTLITSFTSGVILGCLLFVFAPWLAIEVFNKPELILVFRSFAFAFPLIIGLWVASAATRISKNMRYSAITEDLVQPFSNLLLLVLFAFFGLTLSKSISANVISTGTGFILALFFLYYLFGEVLTKPIGNEFSYRELIIFSIPTGLAGTFTLLTGWVSRLFVGYYRPAADVGIYQSASQISLIFVIILNAMNTIFAPMIAGLYHRNEIKRIEELYRVSTKWGLYIILPLYLVILTIPQQFIAAIFGKEYIAGSTAMIVLCTTQVINVGTGAVGFLLTMTGRQNHWFYTSGFTMILCIILNLLLVPIYGLLGAALATSLAVSALYLAGLVQVRLILNLWPYDRRFLKGILAAVAATIVLLGVQRFAGSYPPIWNVLVCVILSFGVFGGVLLLVGLDDEDQEFGAILKNRLNKQR